MKGNKKRGSTITTWESSLGSISRQFSSFTTKNGERERKRERGSPHLEDFLSRDVQKFIEDDSVTPQTVRLSKLSQYLRTPPLLSLTILAGATWHIRALSDAIRVSRSICSISAKNALNLHIFEAAGCHIVSGHGGGPTACHAPY